MKNLLIIAIAFLFTLASCTSTYQAASAYDDVYYTPKNSNQAISSSSKSSTSKVIYSGSSSLDGYQQTSDPQSVAVDERDYKSYNYVEDTLPAASSSDEYYYVEDSEEYYDYDYASRIDRFHNSAGSFGYYAPVYSGYYPSYGPSLSIGYGWGMPSSYFSFGFNYGWGGGYYNPYCYDPWYCNSWYGYPYYGYGGSYWAGYNHGYSNGYYAGGGGYYPGGETIYPDYYNGPRNSRGSSMVGNSATRGSRLEGGEDSEIKNTISSGRGSRVGGAAANGTSIPSGTQTPETQRTSRNLEPQKNATATDTREIRSEKLTKPGSDQVSGSTVGQQKANRQENAGTPEISRKYASPQNATGVEESSRNARAQEKYSQTPGKQYDKPVSGQSREDVYSRSKKYAKPASESLSGNTRTGETKKYTSPNTNRPRSSNEYTVPRSNQTRTYTTPSRSQNTFSSPKRSTNSYSTPSRSNTRNYTTPSRSTSTPSRSYSTPSRSYSTPSRSSRSSGKTYSAPSRSSGSSSGSSGTSRSSGSSSSGKRGR